jgi:hypothetical protein
VARLRGKDVSELMVARKPKPAEQAKPAAQA